MIQPSAALPPPGTSARRSTVAEQELIQSLGWLVMMRWFAGAGVLAITFVSSALLGLAVPAGRLYATGLVILAYNAVLLRRLRRLRTGSMTLPGFRIFRYPLLCPPNKSCVYLPVPRSLIWWWWASMA